MKISIIGGGIGGLTLGNVLKQHHIDFKIYESAPEIKPVGAGIAMAGNAMQIFDKLGLKEKIEKAGTKMHALIITDEKLKTISKTDVLKLESKYNVCNIAIHRAELQKVLSENISENIILNKRLSTIEKKENYHLTFEDKTEIESEIIFGADGVKSLVRNQILKSGEIREAKQKCWRGIIKTEIPEKYSHNAYEMWGKGKRFGFVKIKENTLYWYALVNEKFYSKDIDLLETFKEFHPDVLEMISKTSKENIILNDIIDLKPMEKWSTENLCLIGDSAHATTPNMGQGGCQAVEDAYIIGKLLETEKDWNKVFHQFENIRRLKVNHIVKTSWTLGKVAQWENFTGLRNFVFRNMPESVNQEQMEKILKLEL
ncbi:FAD-dependent monooxygenase [Epilithonimonas ginsengisoli]|uniref:FAD-dependent monooxygenase n=1 Tax=Epilithonimonas ginsengisoli TaxID=1245592 RepID=A0ABU4JFG1_9FLAO|nr:MULTISPECIES: FAD-dependent monooxygenase [Chryseobacterium group]MBV6879718.1 FAD-dependent monooxygenase [Epilithonimonas sp. FP105]MDW8548357.1 FAD-dependent monooxygenase [Epilithonimonas ginsengisoli]OAH72588.1 monooxygenase [Chryseobacterium sp. FP211-J200]